MKDDKLISEKGPAWVRDFGIANHNHLLMYPSVPSVLYVCHSAHLSVSVSPQSKLGNRIMPNTLEVFYLAENLEVRCYGYRPANKHIPEDNFLRNVI